MLSGGRIPFTDGGQEVVDSAPYVYAAAVAASRDREAAAAVTAYILSSAARGSYGSAPERRLLVEEALLLGVRLSPSYVFSIMGREHREAVVLARIGRYPVAEIAQVLGVSAAEVKLRLRHGLEAVASSSIAVP